MAVLRGIKEDCPVPQPANPASDKIGVRASSKDRCQVLDGRAFCSLLQAQVFSYSLNTYLDTRVERQHRTMRKSHDLLQSWPGLLGVGRKSEVR